MVMSKVFCVWIMVAWCLLVPATGNLRSSPQNREEKTEEKPKEPATSNKDFARALHFNFPVPEGNFNLPPPPAGGGIFKNLDQPEVVLTKPFFLGHRRPERDDAQSSADPSVSTSSLAALNDAKTSTDMPSSSPTSSPSSSPTAASLPDSSLENTYYKRFPDSP